MGKKKGWKLNGMKLERKEAQPILKMGNEKGWKLFGIKLEKNG